MENNATVSAIYLSGERGGKMNRVESAMALEGHGLDGDRYARGDGFWQNTGKRTDVIRDVTLIRQEDIEGSSFEQEDTRRNIVVVGEIDLRDLIGHPFRVGEVKLFGVEECTPCKRPSDLSGKPDFAKEFKDKDGIRAEVITWGNINEGDEVIPTVRNAAK